MRDKLLGHKKLMFAGAVVAGALLLGGVLVLTMKQPKIEQIKNEIILEAGTELQLDAKEFFETAEENYDKIKFEKESVDTRAVGDYEVKATFRDKEFLIKVKVQDTIAPEVTLKARHVYMSDLKAPVDIEYEYYDASEVSVTLAGTEKIQGLEDITEKKVKVLTDIIKIPCDQEKLSKITSVTEEEGILRGVLKFEDACGNVQLEEILIVMIDLMELSRPKKQKNLIKRQRIRKKKARKKKIKMIKHLLIIRSLLQINHLILVQGIMVQGILETVVHKIHKLLVDQANQKNQQSKQNQRLKRLNHTLLQQCRQQLTQATIKSFQQRVAVM